MIITQELDLYQKLHVTGNLPYIFGGWQVYFSFKDPVYE